MQRTDSAPFDKPQQTAPESWHVQVRGHVQGVGYRQACTGQARSLGLTGWVRNRTDGSVELMLQGTRERLEAMRGWLRRGVPAARVDDVEVTPVQPAPPQRFERFDRMTTR